MTARFLRPARSYFLTVFAVGFLLGVVRTLWLAPTLGERKAELLELPFMVLVSFLAARWVVRRFGLRGIPKTGLAVGLGALALMLLAELAVVVFILQAPLPAYVASRDPVSGGAYLVSLALFGLMPWLICRGAG